MRSVFLTDCDVCRDAEVHTALAICMCMSVVEFAPIRTQCTHDQKFNKNYCDASFAAVAVAVIRCANMVRMQFQLKRQLASNFVLFFRPLGFVPVSNDQNNLSELDSSENRFR